MRYTIYHSEDEVIEGEIAGVVVQVTKRHCLELAVDVRLNTDTRNFEVTTNAQSLGAIISAEPVRLAPKETPKPAPKAGYYGYGYNGDWTLQHIPPVPAVRPLKPLVPECLRYSDN